MQSRLRSVVCALMVGLVVAGCSQQEMRDRSYGASSQQRIGNVAYDDTFDAAERVFRSFFSTERADRGEGILVARPIEVDKRGEPVGVRDTMTMTPSRRRRVAELRLSRSGSDVLAMCQVKLQRLDTSERRAFRPQIGDDRPSESHPFEAEAGASPSQRELWTDLGRDRELERQVLNALRDRLVREGAPESPGPS
ncbi:MAG: hypothetical protein JXA69_10500 [Phycisphaerae bacterium]|nr:hypothetical protein [Phycisphaerae bacterium]